MAAVDVTSFSFIGAQAVPAVLRAELSPGVAAFRVEGASAMEGEALRSRVAKALLACSLGLPSTGLTVRVISAAPGLGRHLELPAAVAVFAVLATMPTDALAACAVFGALDQDGLVSDVEEVEAAAVQALAHGLDLICPQGQAEAVVAGQAKVLGVGSLLAVLNHFRGTQVITPQGHPLPEVTTDPTDTRRPDHRAVQETVPEDRRRGWLGTLKAWVGAGRSPALRDAQDPLLPYGDVPPPLRGFADRLDLPDTRSTPSALTRSVPASPRSTDATTPFASTGPQGHRARMREKVLARGAGALADYEILEMLLFLAFKTGDTKPLAKAVINNVTGDTPGLVSSPA